jgi:hypothetical protein
MTENPPNLCDCPESHDICEKCGSSVHVGDWPWCPHAAATRRREIACAPVVIYKDAQGNVGYVGSSDPNIRSAKDYEKKGYQRVEMNYYEARKWTRENNIQLRADHARQLERLQAKYEEEQAERRADLRAEMRHMSPLGRAMAQAAIEANNRKEAKAYYSQDLGFHIEGLE